MRSWCSGQHYRLSRLPTVYSAVCWGHDVVVGTTACRAFLLSTALYAGGHDVVVSTTACHAFLQRCMLGSWCSGQHYRLSRLPTVYSAVCWGHDVVVSTTVCHAFLLSTALYAWVMMWWSALPSDTPSYCLQRCSWGHDVVVSTTACHAFLLSTALYAGVMM